MIALTRRTAGFAPVLAAFCLMLAPLAGAWAEAALLTPRAFTDRFVEALHQAAPQLKVTRKSVDELDITAPGEKEPAQLYLGNAYRQYANNPSALDEIIGRFVRVTMAMNQTLPIVRADMRLLIRPASYLAELARLQKEQGMDDPPLSRPFTGDLVILLGQNTPDAYRYPLGSDVRKELGDDQDAIWASARTATLAAMTDIQFETVAPGLVLVSANDDLAPSLLLDDAFWRRKELEGPGELTVAVLDKSTLLVGHVQDQKDFDFLQGFVTEQFDNGDALSKVLLVRRGGQWMVRAPGLETDNSDVTPRPRMG
ncbi:hypothetical protein QO010_001428 [Caulobacter ginsengisoli]|uniref:DUF1444 domain-containing protein n=1 Tax=Caulobacter ginsengisoli TaxID=400775 RepID=A0ABU0INT5_9CAUL|nr:hypothetical protein [Caulobacter ginsengisoli]MDQ0463657.1 hypothetical protein [Caulobacter ginsengisoli]